MILNREIESFAGFYKNQEETVRLTYFNLRFFTEGVLHFYDLNREVESFAGFYKNQEETVRC